MRKQFRICFVTSIHPDFDARVWKYAVMMAGRGHEVHLVCPWRVPDGEIREGVTLHPFRPAPSKIARLFSNVLGLGPKLRPLLPKVDIVHFHDIDILPWMALLALFKPVVYDVHENYPEEVLLKTWLPVPKFFLKFLYHPVRITQSVLSRFVRNVVYVIPEQAVHFPASGVRSIIIRNYATLALLDNVAPDYRNRPPTVIFVGSQYENNGPFVFLDIAERMQARNPAVRFLMAARFGGDEAMRNRVLETIRSRKLDNVTVVPNIAPQRLMEHLNQATIGIQPDLRVPQRIKALPTKFFEFMAAGLPIVASDLPNTIRMSDATGAFLLGRPEDPDTFVSAIETLVSDRELAYSMGQRGQLAFRQRFSFEGQAETLEQFYSQILTSSSDCAQMAASSQSS